ncbi:large conductance mechanosensitive channel protein MscL [Flectobacillus longus]|uniref:large conductance mechanosensitive channel protein MscL n=1 Tax=Flectobacillus longus TaxID=2984207 RepID=UPI0024B77111|nr:large conductance mechanosensitive channel protein MscL [Flectobacillus longus]MDI9879399.1 large conductance mechanosensitive channel protein MscL [Flectobacillus longus]
MLKEFKNFISQGNVLDLAIGVVIGGAFSKITTSLVEDILMPVVGLFLGGIDFSTWKVILKAANPAENQVEVAMKFGNFVQISVNFLIVAWVIFLVIKAASKVGMTDKKFE